MRYNCRTLVFCKNVQRPKEVGLHRCTGQDLHGDPEVGFEPSGGLSMTTTVRRLELGDSPHARKCKFKVAFTVTLAIKIQPNFVHQHVG